MSTSRLLRSVLLTLLWLPLAVLAQPAATTYTKAQLQETYSSFLATEGYRPETLSTGNIKFRREGRTYVIYVDERDPTYFRMQMSYIYDDKSDAQRLRRVDAMNYAISEVKVVKGYALADGSVYFSAELFLIVPGDFKMVLGRLFSGLDLALQKFNTKLAEVPPPR